MKKKATRAPRSRDKRVRPYAWQAVVLEVSIDDLPHPVTRELHVDSGVQLDVLHDVLQIAFGWTNSHLYQFEVGDVVFSEGENGDQHFVDTFAAPLGAIVRTGSEFAYLYDFGDDWRHTIRVTKLVELEEGVMFRCVAGENAGPPEDCGGPHGFERLLSALANPDHPAHDEMQEWVDPKYGPRNCDLKAIERKFEKLRKEVRREMAEAERNARNA